jgi:hypothetical protein
MAVKHVLEEEAPSAVMRARVDHGKGVPASGRVALECPECQASRLVLRMTKYSGQASACSRMNLAQRSS